MMRSLRSAVLAILSVTSSGFYFAPGISADSSHEGGEAAIPDIKEVTMPRVLQMEFTKRDLETPIKKSLHLERRWGGDVELQNNLYSYVICVQMGSPLQKVCLMLDTGSSDLWVNLATSKLCQDPKNGCSGIFDPASSSTFATLSTTFNIDYVDGTGASGQYASDQLTINGVHMEGFQFAVANNYSDIPLAIVGIGPAENTIAYLNSNGLNAYYNLPIALRNASVTACACYSIWLNDIEANMGSILFGGYDRTKFIGNMTIIYSTYSVPGDSKSNPMGLQLEEFNFFDGENAPSFPGTSINQNTFPNNLTVLLDTGTVLTYLPQSVVEPIWARVQATKYKDQSFATLDCGMANQPFRFTFKFNGTVFTVRMDEMVIANGGSSMCTFGIGYIPEFPQGLLGMTFLRSVYAVFNMDSNPPYVGLAPTVFNSTASPDIQEIPTEGEPRFQLKASCTSSVAPSIASTGGISDPSKSKSLISFDGTDGGPRVLSVETTSDRRLKRAAADSWSGGTPRDPLAPTSSNSSSSSGAVSGSGLDACDTLNPNGSALKNALSIWSYFVIALTILSAVVL